MAKRDMDLIRTILLQVEGEGQPDLPNMPKLDGVSDELVAYHIRMMMEAGLLTAVDASSFDGEEYIQISMTWDGHEFLEKVRDPEIWQKTKASAAKVGSFSLGIVAEIAKAAIVAKAQSLGLTS